MEMYSERHGLDYDNNKLTRGRRSLRTFFAQISFIFHVIDFTKFGKNVPIIKSDLGFICHRAFREFGYTQTKINFNEVTSYVIKVRRLKIRSHVLFV